jgi:hypothetical protein
MNQNLETINYSFLAKLQKIAVIEIKYTLV